MADTAARNPNLNEATIKALPIPDKGNRVHYFAGAMLQGAAVPRGFGVRVTAGGARSFVLNYRHRGRERRITIGQYPDWSALRAVREARELRQRVDRGEDPLHDRRLPAPASEAPKTVGEVLDDFVERHVSGLRTARSVESAIQRLAKPVIGQIGIYDMRRRHIAEMLDKIEDQAGPVQADRVLAYVRKAFNWYATRDDDFTSPIIPGMARTRSEERARERVLSDDEIRLIWPLFTAAGTLGSVARLLLLTGQRRAEVAHMRWQEIGADGVWTIPAARYKTKRPHSVPLADAARRVLEQQPRVNEYVFRSTTGAPFSTYAKPKERLDRAVAEANGGEPLPSWTLHDLRRTAKTLMARAGVRPDISERVLGHAIGGVEAVYDRHSYEAEKRDALERLAAMVERILNPPGENVVPLWQAR
jgi:integrase